MPSSPSPACKHESMPCPVKPCPVKPSPEKFGDLQLLCRLAAVTFAYCYVAHLPCYAQLSNPAQISAADHQERFLSSSATSILRDNCLDCHNGSEPEAGLDLQKLLETSSTSVPLPDKQFAIWVAVHDRIAAGEMPPEGGLNSDLQAEVVQPLFKQLVQLDKLQVASEGRTRWRRMNRLEYENSVRELLSAPWLQLATILPADGELHRFNKVGEALDVSHVSMARYMQAAQYALTQSMANHSRRPPTKTIRFYAREQDSFNRRVHYNPFNRSPERATFPLNAYTADLAVLKDPDHPFTVGKANPEVREAEAFGVVASSYEPIEIRFNGFEAPEAGRYKLRFKGYTFWAAGEEKRWWRPDRAKTSRGRRSEPITVYSQLPPRQLRRLGEFDFQIEPTIQELDVWLLKNETIQPDAVRLFRSRPPNWHNPLAEKDGMPGVAFNWMEVEGPIHQQWPPASHKLLFEELPIVKQGNEVSVVSDQPQDDARRLLTKFLNRAYRRITRIESSSEDVERFMAVFEKARGAGFDFDDAILSSYVAVLCSPEFLCMKENTGNLHENSLASRLSLFLWNTTPDPELLELARAESLSNRQTFLGQVDRLLQDERSQRFVNSFLDYWLELRKINDTSPDELLYPDYYLDDSLVDAALAQTRMFFAEVVAKNLPIRTLIDSDFTFVNERLAVHYGLPHLEGAKLKRVDLPPDSPRGGLLTQASILKVTANGTTTSPVVRGAWVNERILGITIPPPPASVPAIEPDTRGATTIREQLDLHRADKTCNICHVKIDPAGFALESFDVVGGFRQYYRSLPVQGQSEDSGEHAKPNEGFGKNGQPFTFHDGPKIDSSGSMPDGHKFAGIDEFKQLILKDDRQIARNLLKQLITYATGAAPRFSDRPEIEKILDRSQPNGFPVRSLIVEVATSNLFTNK